MSIQFASSIVVCLIIAPILFSSTSQRCQFTLSSAGYILYAIANLWPSWYTMVPSAIILGFATGISWAGATLFIPTLATDTGLTAPLLYSIFTGIVQCSSVAGNMVATGIMKSFKVPSPNSTVETSIVFNECVQFEPNAIPMEASNSSFLLSEEAIIEPTGTIANADEEKITEMGKNILILVISSCHVLATFILFCGIRGKYSKVEKRDIENLDSDTNLKTQLETIKDALRRMLIQTRLRKQFLIAPITIYSATVLSFIQTDITRHLIKPCLGISNVPLIMITYGVGISFGCFISSTLYEMLPVKILLLIVGLVDATGFIGLCFWKGEPFTYFVIIAVTAGMGFTGGVFESIIPTLYAVLFDDTREAAFSLWNVLFGLGCVIVFGWSDFLNLKVKCYLLILLLVISLIGLFLVPSEDLQAKSTPTKDDDPSISQSMRKRIESIRSVQSLQTDSLIDNKADELLTKRN